jgi:tetratricopeptide (TPR) repeat protein
MDELPRPVRGGFSQAMTEYIRLLVSQGDLPENIERLADYYAFFKDYNKAVPLYEKILEIEPSNAGVVKRLMEIYSEQGNTESFEKMEKRLKKILPDA